MIFNTAVMVPTHGFVIAFAPGDRYGRGHDASDH
jgi:hypothetical protein